MMIVRTQSLLLCELLYLQADDLLRRLSSSLRNVGDFFVVKALVKVDVDGRTAEQTQMLDQLEIVVRMLSMILTKTPGSLDRITGNGPRCEELPDDVVDLPVSAEAAVSFSELTGRLIKLVLALRPNEHVGPDLEGSSLSRMRGNLALLFASIVEASAHDNAAPELQQVDLSPLVACFLDTLKRERKSVQHNIGVCVTRLAQHPRYRQEIRDLNGIETLHQIHLPKVEAQKQNANQQHRLDTSTTARQHEMMKRRQQQESLRNLD